MKTSATATATATLLLVASMAGEGACSDLPGHGAAAADPPLTKEAKAATALRETSTALRNLAGKIHGEIKFAKRDAFFGKLSAKDLSEIDKLFKRIFVPVCVPLFP